MQHVHFGSCGCGDELRGDLDLYSLNEAISVQSIQTLNEAKPNSGRSVLICSYEDRAATGDRHVTSDCDDEIIFNFSFKEEAKIKAIILSAFVKNLCPKTIKVFLNPASPIDFGNISSIKPTQTLLVKYDPFGNDPIFVRGPQYNKVNHIALHISGRLSSSPSSLTEEEKQILHKAGLAEDHDQMMFEYLGFLGNYTGVYRGAIKDLTYEIVPQMGDHPQEQHSHQATGFGV